VCLVGEHYLLRSAVGRRAAEVAERLDEPNSESWLRLRLRLRLRLGVEWPDEAPALLLGARASVEVIEPADVRARLIRTALRILERYDGAPAGS